MRIAHAAAIAMALSAAGMLRAAGPAGRFTMTAAEQAIIDHTNAERKKARLPPLQPNPALFAAARAHTSNMARQDKLAHELDGKAPADRAQAAGYRYSLVGENVAMGQSGPAEVVEGWMNSPGHRANILKPEFTEIGIGIGRNSDGRPYYTQVFGRPAERTAVPPPPAVQAKVTLSNKADKPVTLTLSDGALRIIPAGQSKVVTASGSGRLPHLKIKNGKDVLQADLEDGFVYELTHDDGVWKIDGQAPEK
mgnify:CR=1 FL=1